MFSATFKKFDKDGSGQLERPEFKKAWEVFILFCQFHLLFKIFEFLGLDGSDGEIQNAYLAVDTDNSGVIDRREFKEAIRGSVTNFLDK